MNQFKIMSKNLLPKLRTENKSFGGCKMIMKPNYPEYTRQKQEE